MSKINSSWEKIISKFEISRSVLEHGYYDITSRDINEHHESRLMCKIDFKEKIPKPLKENHLSVLAIKNGVYRISNTSPFIDIDVNLFKKEPDAYFKLPTNLKTLTADNITSESKALDAAMLSGMLEHLVEDKLCLTIRGREISSDFSFYLLNKNHKKITYDVSGVQIEVDGGYESSEIILLVEAKMDFQSNMNIRQLLYPELSYKTKHKKSIITYVMFYEIGGKFHFLPFVFKNNQCLLDFDKYKLFKLEQNTKKFTLEDLYSIKIDNSKINSNAPFPQADDFNKIYAIFLKVSENSALSKASIFEDLYITNRQYDYYLNTLVWMNLVTYNKDYKLASLTEEGIRLSKMNEADRFFTMAEIIFSNPIFNMVLHNKPEKISNQLFLKNNLNPEASTLKRRLKTVRSWVSFFKNKIDNK